ncbi:uncharacterized protein EDB93DRAFT_1109131 [Suillus bovinus]|uniref:uncharacterized protein n=1 Tax=Suillus bovinus TaxID=48563 RepID=UPI001B873B87|nr:uncharacterized protein EDB93DRAFT_1109131 [Suillus bovinus]KAG2127914.1 hypothetical protein EDB93DRAFT_1109131 [Suillus bovinus]
MMIPRGYMRTFISWLRLIIRTIAFQSYPSIFSVLRRVFRCCQAIIGGNERIFREPDLALGSQPAPINQKTPASVTLAVPSFVPPPQQSDGRTGVASSIQSLDSCAQSIIPMPKPSITTSTAMPPHNVAPIHSVTLIPATPGQIKRYDRIGLNCMHIMFFELFASLIHSYSQGDCAVYEVPKGPLDCSEELALVSGWEPLTHPEGALFFYHSYKRVFTDADIRAPGMVANIGEAVERAYNEVKSAGIKLHSSVELVLELMKGHHEEWGYYFADHDRRIILWFEAHKPSDLIGNVRGVKCGDHITSFIAPLPGYALESQYWLHVELYPNKRPLPKVVVMRLREIVMYTQADNVTSDTSLTPFSSEEVASMLSLMDPLMDSAGIEYPHEHSVWIVARFMGEFCNVKFVNFCGQPGARLNADQSLYRDTNTHSNNILLRVMNFILFGSPNAYNKVLQKIWVDSTIVQPRWKNFINRLNNEWNGYTIFSTVMLAVDISFLTISSVETQKAATLVSYMSTLCVLGSLVVSLVLAGQVNDSRRDSAKSVASFMEGISASVLGLEGLALMLCLPFALLIWGMTFFAAALSIVIFNTSGVITISIISPIWVAILILSTWPETPRHWSSEPGKILEGKFV